jgi:hypothetical protein
MKGLAYYYAEFQRELAAVDLRLVEEFKDVSSTQSPRDVFRWLEERRTHGQLPASLENVLTDFYWELS